MGTSSNAAVENLRTYLRIPSVHPDINYEPCIEFLRVQAEEIGLTYNVYRPLANFPHAVLTWTGKEPSLPSIMLNSHMDVVPVFEEKWSHKPFDADIDEKGNIYARGIQDTKALGIQYLEAIRRLKKSGLQLKRTVHVTFVPDEEVGGRNGVEIFVKTPEFKAMNVGFALDEGVSSENNVSVAFYGEKRAWKFAVHCTGQPGHGSLLIDNTAGEKAQYVLKKIYEFRAEQKKRLTDIFSNNNLNTINLTVLKGGVQDNVIPDEFTMIFDSRVLSQYLSTFEAQIHQWCKEAGTGVTVEGLLKGVEAPNTVIDDSNPYWVAFKEVMENLGVPLKPIICPATSDGRFLRAIGIPTIGFSPNLNTPIRAHENDEFLNVDEFLEGIRKFEKIIPAIANV